MLSQSLRVLSVRDQASICPFALREVSVLAELALGHLRYSLTDVPPQSNSPPGGVLGIRIAPGPGPADATRARTPHRRPAERTAGTGGRVAARAAAPRFDARCPRLALNATGISTAARHGRAQADGRARTAQPTPAGPWGPTRRATAGPRGRRPDAPAAGTARSASPSKWGNDASSGISRSARRRTAAKPPALTPVSHLCYTSACLRTMPD
jgi:hypothetical protein